MHTSVPPTFAEGDFRKAARSEPNKSCVRVARRDGWVAVRDDKISFGSEDDHRLLLTAAAFDDAQDRWRDRRQGGALEIVDCANDLAVMRLAGGVGPELRFTGPEIDAFRDGVDRREFDADSLVGHH